MEWALRLEAANKSILLKHSPYLSVHLNAEMSVNKIQSSLFARVNILNTLNFIAQRNVVHKETQIFKLRRAHSLIHLYSVWVCVCVHQKYQMPDPSDRRERWNMDEIVVIMCQHSENAPHHIPYRIFIFRSFIEYYAYMPCRCRVTCTHTQNAICRERNISISYTSPHNRFNIYN